MKPFMGFYPVQLEALKALWQSVSDGVGIPLQTCLDKNGNTSDTVDQKAAAGNFKGFISHYHITKKKIDCAGLDIQLMLSEIK